MAVRSASYPDIDDARARNAAPNPHANHAEAGTRAV